MVAPVLFSSAREKWATPPDFYKKLDAEFHFTLDPCPIGWQPSDPDGREISWAGHRVYCNPPYGRGVGRWLAKAYEAEVAVYLLPSRTDTRWWHEHSPRASEIRFVKGRLYFGDGTGPAPFPSVVLVYRRIG